MSKGVKVTVLEDELEALNEIAEAALELKFDTAGRGYECLEQRKSPRLQKLRKAVESYKPYVTAEPIKEDDDES